MKSDLYRLVKETLLKAGMKSVTLFHMPSMEIISRCPLAMVQFVDVKYSARTGRVQEGTGDIVVHVLYDSLKYEDDEKLLESTQKVFVEMAKAGFTRTSEKSGLFDEACKDFQITFTSPIWIDEDAKDALLTIAKPNLEIK